LYASRPRLASIVVALVLALFISPVSAPASASAAESDIATILTNTNAARTSAGLPALNRNVAMDAVALSWAKKMAAEGTMSHNPSYSAQIPSGWSRASENVAYGFRSGAVVTGWLNSAGHRANIMGDVTDVGIGYFVDTKGVAWSVQNFAKYAKSAGAKTVSAVTPKVNGAVRVGQHLTAVTGTWSPSSVTLTYQWKRGGVAIIGATAKSYKLTSSDVGHTLSLAVTGKSSGYASATRTSLSTLEVMG
jgi:hypothetical protein